ncbi:MAG TPA: hypothetical protein VM165_22050 [Planctomycetaceae bacterium]|nr:hypothetical protein [Planctomycetaceae bacterium]
MTTPVPKPPSTPTVSESPRVAGTYSTLRADQIVATAEQLTRRIEERFPSSGLRGVAEALTGVARKAIQRAEGIRRPFYLMRLTAALLIACLLGLLGIIARNVRELGEVYNLEHFVQTLEAGLGSLVFIGAAIIYLGSLERRWKRERLLAAMRELRALAHIVDMHQLTKDPESTHQQRPTASSPKRTLTTFELSRYLDYCSEVLSLTSKVGAIYVQEFPDPIAQEAADQLATLTNDLSRTIWQKMMILDRAAEPAGKAPTSGNNPQA